MTTRARVLAGVVGLLSAACQPMNQEKYVEERALRRWSVSSAQGAVLAEACTVWTSDFPSQAKTFDNYPAVELSLAAGASITYEDNLATEYVVKSRVGDPLPTTDDFWCADFEKYRAGAVTGPGLDSIAVVDSQPAAKLESVELIEPETVGEPPVVRAVGFRAKLTVVGVGPVTLGVPEKWPNNFAFSFTAMVIEP